MAPEQTAKSRPLSALGPPRGCRRLGLVGEPLRQGAGAAPRDVPVTCWNVVADVAAEAGEIVVRERAAVCGEPVEQGAQRGAGRLHRAGVEVHELTLDAVAGRPPAVLLDLPGLVD